MLTPFSAYQDFLTTCLKNPVDRTPRLVLADFLADHNDPRAPLLRMTAALETTPVPADMDRRCWALCGGIPTRNKDALTPPASPVTPALYSLYRSTVGRRGGWVRLWTVGCVRDNLTGFGGTHAAVDGTFLQTVLQSLLKFELYACRLVPRAFLDYAAAFRMYNHCPAAEKEWWDIYSRDGTLWGRDRVDMIVMPSTYVVDEPLDRVVFGSRSPLGLASLWVRYGYRIVRWPAGYAMLTASPDHRWVNGAFLLARYRQLADRFAQLPAELGFDGNALATHEEAAKKETRAARPPRTRKAKKRRSD